MTTLAPLTLDVRAELRNGGEPLPRILQAVTQLQPDQPLRLLATFEPIPLYTVLGRKGFSHAASRHGNGDWEILLTPSTPTPNKQHESPPRAISASTAAWPPPKDFLDNPGLLPPEPMIRILEALERLAAGEVLEAVNER